MASEAATQVLTQPGSDAATSVLPATSVLHDEPEAEPEQQEKKRSPWTWPLITLIALLLLIIGGTVFAVMSSGDGGGEKTTTSSTKTTTKKPTTTTSKAPTAGPIVAADLVGMNIDAAEQKLKDAGFTNIKREPGSPDVDAKVNTVQSVSPEGQRVPFPDQVTHKFHDAFGAPNAPVSKPFSEPASPVAEDSTVTIRWNDSSSSCLAGTSLVEYRLQVSGDPAVTAPAPTSGTFASLTVGKAATLNISYSVVCGGAGITPQQSGWSSPLELVVKATP